MGSPIELDPIATVRGGRSFLRDDGWDAEQAVIELEDHICIDALAGLNQFSHAVIVFQFHRVPLDRIATGARHPRNNIEWPKVGIFAQRGKNRPNRIGVSICRISGVQGRTLTVRGLDAIDGSPVLDIKPHMTGFNARGVVREPDWATELMRGYWT